MKPEQNVWHLADHIFKCIFLRERSDLLTQISSKFVAKVPFDSMSALIQVSNKWQAIAWTNADQVASLYGVTGTHKVKG